MLLKISSFCLRFVLVEPCSPAMCFAYFVVGAWAAETLPVDAPLPDVSPVQVAVLHRGATGPFAGRGRSAP